MIEALNAGSPIDTQAAGTGKKILYWKKNERMGGMVPVWGIDNTAKGSVEEKLSVAVTGNPEKDSFETALAYAGAASSQNTQDEEFGFGDLIDMVNPLHHLPLVGYLYREITGDEIKPVAKIIGDGIFGGVAGAAASLVDTVIEYETGKSVTGNMVALLTEGQTPEYRTAATDQPEKHLNKALKDIENNPHNLPGSAISFTDLGYGKREIHEYVLAADGRTAGTMSRKHTEITPPNPVREPIARVRFNDYSRSR